MDTKKRVRRSASSSSDSLPNTKKLKGNKDTVPASRNKGSLIPQQKITSIFDFIKKAVVKRVKPKELQNISAILRVSITEGDLLLGKDGKSNISKIERLCEGSSITVGDKVDRSIDREITIEGTLRSVTISLIAVIYFLHTFIDNSSSIETIYHFTLLVSHKAISSIGLDELYNTLPSIDISSTMIPFSTFHSVCFQGVLISLIEQVILFIQTINSKQLKNSMPVILPKARIPIDGVYHPTKIIEAKAIIEKSKNSFLQYVKQDTKETISNSENVDVKQLTIKQIEQAIQECNKQMKSLDQFKYTIDFPTDYIPHLNLTEIRSKSNSNVVVLDKNTMESYKQLHVTGLAESNLTALRFLLKAL